MSERRFLGQVSKDGKLTLREQPAFRSVLRDLSGQEVILSIDKARKVRSTQQGRYYWGCVVPAFQKVWSIARQRIDLEPLTKDETHDVLVQVLLGSVDGPMPGTRLPKKTSKMTTKEFSDYIEGCLELALTEYKMHIPPANSWRGE